MTQIAGPMLATQYARIYRFFRNRTSDPEVAADLTQEVFAGAARTLASSEAVTFPLEALLFTIARRRFADEVRRAARQPQLVPLVEADEPNERREELTGYSGPLLSAIRTALGRLDSNDRQLLAWRLFEGRPFRELSQRLDISETAVKLRFVRSLRLLRIELEKEGVEP
jgi:RNA polymerase sigma factor (sigma-70 family)